MNEKEARNFAHWMFRTFPHLALDCGGHGNGQQYHSFSCNTITDQLLRQFPTLIVQQKDDGVYEAKINDVCIRAFCAENMIDWLSGKGACVIRKRKPTEE